MECMLMHPRALHHPFLCGAPVSSYPWRSLTKTPSRVTSPTPCPLLAYLQAAAVSDKGGELEWETNYERAITVRGRRAESNTSCVQ